MSIGENLKRIRESRNITQVELAETVGVASPMICQIERGSRALSLPLALEIAKVLKCDVNDFGE